MQTEQPVKETVEKTEEVPEKTEKTEKPKKESKKPKKKNQKREGKDNERPNKPKRQRKYMFNEPENWRETLEKEITLETKAPPQRKKADLMKKPERDELTKKLNKKNELIQKKRKEIDELYKEKDRLRDEDRKKSNEGYNQFQELKKEKEEAWKLLSEAREKFKWKQLRENQNKTREKLKTIMDKSPFKGIAKSMAQAENHINRLKLEFRDKKKTAKEEKAMNEKIKKFEDKLGVFEKVDNLQKKLDTLREKMNKAKDEIKPLEKKYDVAKKKLNKNHDEFKKKKEEERLKNGGEPVEKKNTEKKERILTEGEKEVVKKVQKKREEIDRIRKEKDALFDEFDKKMMEFRMDHFNFAKENHTHRILKKLKWEEKQKKYEEEKSKREEERLQRLKDARKEIFTTELEKINSVNGSLQLLKLDKERGSMINQPSKAKVEGNPTDIGELNLEEENLLLMQSKKKDNYHAKPVSKKQKKRRNRQKPKVNIAQITSKTETKSLLTPDIALVLKEMKIDAPTDLSQVDDVIKAVSAKREEYLKLRERYVNEEKFEGDEAEMVSRAESVMNSVGEGADDEGEVKEHKEKKFKKKGGKKKKASKALDSGDEFPSL